MSKLTQEDNAKLNAFIVTAVLSNLKIPVENGLRPVAMTTTIQQLIDERTTSTSSLNDFYKFLTEVKAPASSGRRSKEGKQFYAGPYTAAEVADIVDIIIVRREELAEVKEKNAKIKSIETQLLDMETPQEKRDRLTQELAGLKKDS